VQFFAKKGGLIFRYEKKEYIFVIWALKGMSPVNLKKKFENFLRLHYWVNSTGGGGSSAVKYFPVIPAHIPDILGKAK
jgi:hypothetical protein